MSAVDINRLCHVYSRNLAPEGTLVAGAGWLDIDDLTLPNLVQDTARWAGTGIASFDLVLPQNEEVSALVLSGVTCATDTKRRVTWYADEVGATLYDGAPAPSWGFAWNRLHDTADLPIEAANWISGRPTERDFRGRRKHIIVQLPAQIRPRRVRVELDTGGESFDAGYLYVASADVPEWGINWGRRREPTFGSQVDRTPGGGRIVRPGQLGRIHSYEFADLTRTEADWFEALTSILDQETPLLVIPDPGAEDRFVWADLVLGFLASPTAVEEQDPDRWKGILKVEEMVG